MSGSWVWVPDGWRVVPEVPTDEMLDAWDAAEAAHGDNELMVRAVVRAAPEPPSGWQEGYPPEHVYWQEGRYHRKDAALGYWDNEHMVAWHTPLPPPPEVKP